MAAGLYHTCVAGLHNGVTGLYCFGGGQNHNYGQLGAGAITDGTLNFTGLTNITALAAADYHTCAVGKLNNIAGLYCFRGAGHNVGQLGIIANAQTNGNPNKIPLNNVTHVAAGFDHTCAAGTPTAGGTTGLYCFGRGSDPGNQLGPNATIGGTLNFTGITNVTALAASNSHTCAVGTFNNNTRLYCFGGDEGSGGMTSYQLGPNLVVGGPINEVPGFTNVTELAAGMYHTCAAGNFNNTPGLYCWGCG